MKNKVLGSVLGSALLAGSTAVVADSPFAAENFSSTLTFTTDYTFRGVTFSEDDFAIQGSFDWGNGPWFAGAWASSTTPYSESGLGGTAELDLYFGWADNVGGVDLMVMPLWYTFPGESGAGDNTTFELWTSAGMGFDNLPGTPYVTLSANYAPEYFDCDTCANSDGDADSALYTSIAVAFALPDGWGLDFLYGYQDVGGTGENAFFADDYSHVQVGLTKSAAGFDFDVRYHDNKDASTIGKGFAKDSEVEFTVSRSF